MAKSTPLPPFISRQVSAARYFFLNLDPAPGTQLTVVCGGGETCQQAYEINRATFSYHSIEFVSAGHAQLTIGGGEYELRAGSVFGYGPATPHRIVARGREPLVKYFINFHGKQAPKLLARAGLAEPRPRVIAPLRWLHENFNQLLECATQPRDLAGRQAMLLLQLIITQLEGNARPLEGEASQAFARFEDCRRFMEDHFLRVHTSAEVARACHMDVAYLCRLFQRFARQSPYQFLTRLKVDHAATLMLRQEATVKEAALTVGFDDPYHFSRVFKRVHGLSPRNFVRQVGRN